MLAKRTWDTSDTAALGLTQSSGGRIGSSEAAILTLVRHWLQPQPGLAKSIPGQGRRTKVPFVLLVRASEKVLGQSGLSQYNSPNKLQVTDSEFPQLVENFAVGQSRTDEGSKREEAERMAKRQQLREPKPPQGRRAPYLHSGGLWSS